MASTSLDNSMSTLASGSNVIEGEIDKLLIDVLILVPKRRRRVYN